MIAYAIGLLLLLSPLLFVAWRSVSAVGPGFLLLLACMGLVFALIHHVATHTSDTSTR